MTANTGPASTGPASTGSAGTGSGRWELLRALGAVADSPAAARAVTTALGLPQVSDADHTDVFVLNAAPYAAIYLGPEGALGGEGADRAAGFWRAIEITPPTEPDHLAALLGLYARLGEAAADAARPATAAALARSQAALFAEHLWPWLPAYLDAVASLPSASLAAWSGLTRQTLAAELAAQPPAPGLPLALREAPPGIPGPDDGGLRDLVDALTTPIRSGIILTRHALAEGAGQAGVGHRIGERRFTLRAMLEQDPAATLSWLEAEARRWQARHAGRGDPASRWWAARAAHTADLLSGSAAAAGPVR